MKFIPNVVTRKVAMSSLQLQKVSPNVLFIAGVVGVVGTVVLASRATLKVEDILEETSAKLEDVKTLEHREYSDEDRTRDKIVIFLDTSVQLGKLYAPAVILGVISIGCLTQSHRILTRRNAALTAAYAGLDKAFQAYRERVREAVGPEKEQELYRPTEIVKVVDNNGVEQKIKVAKGPGMSPYARVFDEHNPHWNKTPEMNQFFIQCQQNYANDYLRARGHMFLNEVYDMLGLDRSKEGAVVGWVLGNGDDYIDFGVFDGDWQSGLRFAKGEERSVWLDFNVDGIIYDKI